MSGLLHFPIGAAATVICPVIARISKVWTVSPFELFVLDSTYSRLCNFYGLGLFLIYYLLI